MKVDVGQHVHMPNISMNGLCVGAGDDFVATRRVGRCPENAGQPVCTSRSILQLCLRSKFGKLKIASNPHAQSSLCWSFFPIPCPSQLIHIPTTHLGVPLWRTNVSPITTAHRHQNLARTALTHALTHDFSELEILGVVVYECMCVGGTVDTG